MLYIFLDTNIFIHFVDFEQINWHVSLNTTDEITIIIAPIVIDELDKHKYNRNQKISKRVKKLLPKIESYIDNPLLCKFGFNYISKKPSDTTFLENDLDNKEQDDCLLSTIIEFVPSIAEGDKILYVTNDVGPRLKAKVLNIPTYKMPDEHLLKSEPDEFESKSILLQKELNELKNRTPLVFLCFSNEKSHITYTPKKNKYTKDEFINTELEKIKLQHPYLVLSQSEQIQTGNLSTFSNLTLSAEQINDYNLELDTFYEKYNSYVESVYYATNFRIHSIEIQLMLANKGTSPAIDIDVEIYFPDGFELVLKEDLPKFKKKPELPYKPKHRYDILSSFKMPNILTPHLFGSPNIPEINESNPSIKKTNSYNVTHHLKTLKHNQNFNFSTLYAKFPDINKAKGFTLDYKLIISNVPNVITGQLHINFE